MKRFDNETGGRAGIRAVAAASARTGFAELCAERGLCFGGDYNPEQWPRDVWREDVRLMVEAGVNVVTVGVFSWASIEPRPGAREFGWLDDVLDLLHRNGIAVDLATPTASPPPWLGVQHPETLPVDRDGVRLAAGSRNQFAPASAVYRERALAIATDLAVRYASHPAVRMWHVGNEYGQIDYGDQAARGFRAWLRRRYGTIAALNDAWGTSVWSQRYATFDEILPPRRAPYMINPSHAVDFRRYSSDELLACFTEQRDAIRAAGSTAPVTTNFMGFFPLADYWSWADAVDVIADDEYPDPSAPDAPADTALIQDLMRSLGHGRPWLLMEQAIGAVSWRGHNVPKPPARARLSTVQAVAHGADGACFFQWRQSAVGPERFHSGMVPHAGADTDVFRGVVALGADLRRLRPVVGGRISAHVAIVFDWPSWWAADEPGRPSERLRTVEQVQRWYRVLWRHGVVADVVRPGDDVTAYRTVLVPHGYVVSSAAADALRHAAHGGARLVVGPFSGVADDNGHILQGRFPVPLRDIVGVSGEEWLALPDQTVELTITAGALGAADGHGAASILGERLRTEGADVVAAFDTGPLAGLPAVTRNTVGEGQVWYLGTVVDDRLLAAVLGAVLADAGVVNALGAPVDPGRPLPAGVEAVRRGDALFLINHSPAPAHASVRDVPPASVLLPTAMHDLLSEQDFDDVAALSPGATMVLIERRTT